MIKHPESHMDHGFTQDQWTHIFAKFAGRDAFFIETIELPYHLGEVTNELYGPSAGDLPVPESDVFYAPRGDRAWDSRMTKRSKRPTRFVRVIAGPHEEACIRCRGAGSCFYDPGFGTQFAGVHTCPMCGGAKTFKHACILYTAYGVASIDMPQSPKEPGDLYARLWAQPTVEALIFSYRRLLDPSTVGAALEHATQKVREWEALEKEYDVAREFWLRHALASE